MPKLPGALAPRQRTHRWGFGCGDLVLALLWFRPLRAYLREIVCSVLLRRAKLQRAPLGKLLIQNLTSNSLS